MRSVPAGADVFFREYGNPHAEWLYLGKTPLDDLKLVFAQYSLRLVKDGFEPLEVTSEYATLRVTVNYSSRHMN